MAKKVIVLLAEGFEEVEAVTSIDFLRRGGLEVTIAAVGTGAAAGKGAAVTGSHGITVEADAALGELAGKGAAPWDAVVCPGGLPGAANLAASGEAGALLAGMAGSGKWVCAICAAPALVLAPLGLLKGKKFTGYPGLEQSVPSTPSGGAVFLEDRVVVDGNIITSRGPGTAGVFAAAIVGKLVSAAEEEKLLRAALLS
ncbi:MAG: DJ-1/PfpI family protein [Treponema sp.]|jgi:4-methyl-5(b-hydroxyethyl)-thiazole monophosphate biosynthesis|nr:DJ-1/PfpI family protein [Treponema sp.]